MSVCVEKRKKLSSNQRKWISYKKLWLKYKIAIGKNDYDLAKKTALKIQKIELGGLFKKDGTKISVHEFPKVGVLLVRQEI